jgi:hypothetical protein
MYTLPDRRLLGRLDVGNRLRFTYEDRSYWQTMLIDDGQSDASRERSERPVDL